MEWAENLHCLAEMSKILTGNAVRVPTAIDLVNTEANISN